MTNAIGDCVQDKDKLPAPLKSLDLRSGFKSGIREDDTPSENSDRIIQQTVGITASPSGTPGHTHAHTSPLSHTLTQSHTPSLHR
jgi:hypothetical protein